MNFRIESGFLANPDPDSGKKVRTGFGKKLIQKTLLETHRLLGGVHAELVLDELLRGGELLALLEAQVLEDGTQGGATLRLPHHLRIYSI